MSKDLESYIEFYRKLSKKIEIEKASYEEKFDLLLYTAEYIIKGQQKYLNANSYSNEEIINFDNKVSKFADFVYRKMNLMFSDASIKTISQDKIVKFIEKRNQMLYIASRWNTLRVMEVFDLGRDLKKQKVPRRLPLLVEPCFCYDRVLETALGIFHEDGFNPNRGVICMPPSSGKTYAANVYTDLMLMHFWLRYGESGIIRMTNNSTNAQNYGNQCATMIEDSVWQMIFPEIWKYKNQKGQMDCFKNRSAEKLLLKDCNPEVSDSIFMFGAEAGINGKRSMLGAILDDLSNGVDDMDNDELHKKLTDKTMSDVMDRSDDDNSPIIVQGTMYNQYDTQNTFIEMWEKRGMKKIARFRFIKVTNDGKCFTCLVDIEDENGKSIAKELYSDYKLSEKREYFQSRGKPYVYNLIYRQRKDSREPKTFGLDNLVLYNYRRRSDNLDKYAVTMADTTRRSGNDFFAMPIFRFNPETGRYRLVDCIFEQKSLGIVDDPKNAFAEKICKKIVAESIIEFCLESNTSNTASALLKEICRKEGYISCKFRDRYTAKRGKTSSKVVRILNMEETIKNHIEFPDPNTLPQNSPLFLFMSYLTSWNSKEGQKKTNPDDAPDSLAMFVEEFIFKKQRKGVIKEIPSIW